MTDTHLDLVHSIYLLLRLSFLPSLRRFSIVINGEKAAFNTPIFSQKRERTLDMLIRDMYAEVMTEHRGVRDVNAQLPIVI